MKNSKRAFERAVRPSVVPSLLLALGLAGCSEELGPEKFRTTTASGRVTAMGRGLGPGWVEFIPVDGTTGLLTTARVDAEGRFKADRVPVGLVAIAFARMPSDQIVTSLGTIPTRIFQFNTTPIRRQIPETPAGELIIDVDVEFGKFAAEQDRIKKARGASGP